MTLRAISDGGRRLSVGEIERIVEEGRAQLGSSGEPLDLHTDRDSAWPFVQVDERYHYVARERGEEIMRQSSGEIDDLLYWIFDDLTRQMASGYELRHRALESDPRRLRFARQLELLERLRPDWAERKRGELADILKRHPFRDDPAPR